MLKYIKTMQVSAANVTPCLIIILAKPGVMHKIQYVPQQTTTVPRSK